MFSSIIDSLASLLPKYFIFGSYVPTLIFLFVNAAFAYGTFAPLRAALRGLTAPQAAIATTTAFAGTIIVAYVYSAVSEFLRGILEGWHWGSLGDRMSDAQGEERSGLQRAWQTARDAARDYPEMRVRLRTDIADALRAGRAAQAAGAQAAGYEPSKESREIRKLQRRISSVTVEHLRDLVNRFCAIARTHDSRTSEALRADAAQLRLVLNDAQDALDDCARKAYEQRTRRFGEGRPAPTGLGNAANAVDTYARTRYGFEMDALWSAMLLTLQRTDDKAYARLLDAKTQLDFLVACFWYTVLTTASWCLLLAGFSAAPVTFVVVALGGAAAAFAYWKLIATNYYAYAAVVRSTIDGFRFALLRDLHVPLPGGIRDERALWAAIAGVSSFANPVELSYDHRA